MWGEVVLSTNYILNKLLKKKVTMSLWKGIKYSYKYLRVWCCLTEVDVHAKESENRPKNYRLRLY